MMRTGLPTYSHFFSFDKPPVRIFSFLNISEIVIFQNVYAL